MTIVNEIIGEQHDAEIKKYKDALIHARNALVQTRSSGCDGDEDGVGHDEECWRCIQDAAIAHIDDILGD